MDTARVVWLLDQQIAALTKLRDELHEAHYVDMASEAQHIAHRTLCVDDMGKLECVCGLVP